LTTSTHYGGTSTQTTLPTTINHQTIINYPTVWPTGWTRDAGTGAHISTLTNTATGHTVTSRFTGTYGNAQDPYTIEVHDKNGNKLTEYDSQAPRDAGYIQNRAYQVAQYVDSQIPAITAANTASYHAPIQQFAHYYAAKNGTATTIPDAGYKIDETSWNDPQQRAIAAAHLATTFPKLLTPVADQHGPHAGLSVIQHTMRVVDPTNLRTLGMTQRNAELLRLGMIYHDVGKQYGGKDPEHPRKSVTDAEPHLWQYGLTPEEHRDVSAVIKWHDAYGDAMKNGARPSDIDKVARLTYEYTDPTADTATRTTQAHRINDFLMRSWQSDLNTIPGLSNQDVLGIRHTGSIDVDREGPIFKSGVRRRIDAIAQSGNIPTGMVPLVRPAHATTTQAPNLIPSDVKYGELVQRHENLPYGEQVPFDSVINAPQDVYDEAKLLSYARAMHMAYDGPTGAIVKVIHGTDQQYVQSITATGLRPGSTNAFGKGIYTTVNGVNNAASGYGPPYVVTEYHTGRTIHYNDVDALRYKWVQQHPKEAAKLDHREQQAAAALAAGYSSIVSDRSGNPMMVLLDPARAKILTITDRQGKGEHVMVNHKPVDFRDMTSDELHTRKGTPSYHPIRADGSPEGYRGVARIT